MSSSRKSPRTVVLLPDELVTEIISRLGTVGEVVRCSSLLSKRWRNAWRSIRCGVLDFDKFDEVLRLSSNNTTTESDHEAKCRFANRVDQALASLILNMADGLKIGFYLAGMEGVVSRWVELALTKRVKQLSLALYDNPSFGFFTPEFLAGHDLSRLQVLELFALSYIPQESLDCVLSACPSLQRLSLRRCHIRGNRRDNSAVIRVHHSPNNNNNNSSNLECLELDQIVGLARIELISAPRLHTFNFTSRECDWRVEFGDDLPCLQGTLFSCRGCLLPWSGLRGEFSKFAPRLQRLGLEFADHNFVPHLAAAPKWLLFENLRVLDLFAYLDVDPPSLLECTVLLRAAPVLRQLSMWFKYGTGLVGCRSSRERRWRRDLSSTWKHHSLEVLQLHGVHPSAETSRVAFDLRKCQLELAAYIIMSAPSLSRVEIDTRRRDPVHDCVGRTRLCDPIDAHVYEAKVELEMQLQGRCSASPHINFIYQ